MKAWIGVIFLSVAALACAQDKPAAGVTEVIVAYSAGGGVDLMARAFARQAARMSGQNWVVTNRDGAAGIIGFAALTRAAPNGQTLAFSPASPITHAPLLFKTMPYRNEQVEPVCQVFENIFTIAVRADSPIQTLQDLAARARAAPGKLVSRHRSDVVGCAPPSERSAMRIAQPIPSVLASDATPRCASMASADRQMIGDATLAYGHAGNGSVPHLGVAALAKALGVQFDPVAFKGDSAVLAQLLGGHLDFAALAIASITGKGLRVLALLSDKRHPLLPEAPSLADLGYPAVTPGLNGIFAPAATPPATLARIQGLCQKVLASDGFRQAALGLNQVPAYLDAAQFKARILSTYQANAELLPHLDLERH
ncbi:tripartite tricarboxylate transporter substrate binding protein [Verminephrobacter eiseniae]|uniref:tripartite tricarboxylate transporter substrate binding protein n=1 Tax=Verminephrobacter eiseniae TaxID=364317 RepID=UPI0022390819|nr:tripartite tricarboxylate transporter substrate binding protein [Verminephrobacter eiseniae]MCW5236833.1 tripartite tricarboxylate transporter substrate binding protein [Verminephrobacter eiseniae]